MLVLLVAFVARGRARGAEGVVRALLAAGLILAPQPTGPTLVLLGNPDHSAPGSPCCSCCCCSTGPARPQRGAGRRGGAAGLVDHRRSAHRGRRRRAALRRVRAPGPSGSSGRGRSCAGESGRPGWRAGPPPGTSCRSRRGGRGRPPREGGELADQGPGRVHRGQPVYLPAAVQEIIRGLPVVWESVLVLFGADYAGVHGAGNIAFALVHLIGVAVVLAAAGVAAWAAWGMRALARPRLAGRARGAGTACPVTWLPTSSCSASRPTSRRSSSRCRCQRLLLPRDRARSCRSAPRWPGTLGSRILAAGRRP